MMRLVLGDNFREEHLLLAEVNVPAGRICPDILEPGEVAARGVAAGGSVDRFLVKGFGSAAVSDSFEHGADEIEPGRIATGFAKQDAQRVFSEVNVLVPDGAVNSR